MRVNEDVSSHSVSISVMKKLGFFFTYGVIILNPLAARKERKVNEHAE